MQERAGTLAESARILDGHIGTVVRGHGLAIMEGGQQREVFVSSVDARGRVWASALYGEAGFVTRESGGSEGEPDTLYIRPGGGHGGLSWHGDGFLDGLTADAAMVGVLFMDQVGANGSRICASRNVSECNCCFVWRSDCSGVRAPALKARSMCSSCRCRPSASGSAGTSRAATAAAAARVVAAVAAVAPSWR
jgi:hypothetical protein